MAMLNNQMVTVQYVKYHRYNTISEKSTIYITNIN